MAAEAGGGDLIAHDLSPDCVCGPKVLPEKLPDGSVGWIYVHHSLDGREFTEPDYEGPPMPLEAT